MDRTTVWYDGNCRLCAREIAVMRALDRQRTIHFVDLREECANCPVDRSVLLARFHASENGTLLSGAAAFAAMWRAIPLLRPLGFLARNAQVLRALERIYLLFLRFRPHIQRMMKATQHRE